MARTLKELRPHLKVLFVSGFAQGASTRNDVLLPGMQLLTNPLGMRTPSNCVHRMIGTDWRLITERAAGPSMTHCMKSVS